MLARSRYILTKKKANWTENQTQRAALLFKNFPLLKTDYNHTLCFLNNYEKKREDESSLKLVGNYKNIEIWDLSNKLNCKTPILN